MAFDLFGNNSVSCFCVKVTLDFFSKSTSVFGPNMCKTFKMTANVVGGISCKLRKLVKK